MDKEAILSDIFENDPLGILEVKAKNSVITADDRLIASFEEINAFFAKNQRVPQIPTSDMRERQLFSRLKGIKSSLSKKESLKQHDRFNLLKEA